MEQNVKVEKKHRSSLAVVLITAILSCSIFVALVLTGIIPVKTSIGFKDIETAKLVKKSAKVSDEATLRELLLLKENLDITVTEDIEIDESFVVKGVKTLRGNVTISADVAGEFRQMSIFDIQMGASLTMDGLILDGHGTADGIHINQKAQLTILSGTIQYMRNGVSGNGVLDIDGGLIQCCSQYAIFAGFKSDVNLDGGKIYNTGENALFVEKTAHVEMYEGTLIDKCRGYAVKNEGELYVYGGTLSNISAVGIMTKDKMHIEYKGNKADGHIVLENIGTSGIHIYGKEDIYISDIKGTNIGKNAVWNAKEATGAVTIEDCEFDKVGVVDSNGFSLHGKVTITRVSIKNANEGGMNLRPDSEVTLKDVTMENVVGTAITADCKVQGENVKISGATQHNLLSMIGSEVDLKDCVFEKSKRTSIYMGAKANLTLDNVEIQGVLDDDLYCVHVSEEANFTIKGKTSITGAPRVAVCLYKNAKMTMEDGKIFGVKGNDNGAGVWVREEGAVFTMKGGSIQDNYTKSTSGAVYVANKTTFNMYGGAISGNSCDYSGGAVQVQGVMNMYGGTISDNYSKTSGGGINVGNNRDKGIFGTLNVYGGTIKNNKALDGGGIHVSGGTTCNISGGTIQNNEAERHGDGIKDNGTLTISKQAYIPGNAIELDSTSVILKIEGNTLAKHSKKDPLHVIPCGFTNVGNVVVECDSNSASASLLDNYVTSGTRAYTLKQKDNNMTVSINSADMDMSGAKSVYVSTFQELKEAVETAEDKLIVVICADIKWESPITPPLGTTVKVRDDGQTRTLSRAEGNTSRFFISFFGSGFILEATSPGRLVVDGKATSELTGSVVSMFMRGDTIVSGVTFKDNGFADGSGGGFFNQINGTAHISECTFENGSAINGGAINQAGGAMVVEECIFKNNQASEYGGAVYFMGKSAQVKNCTFITNEATRGGAMYGGTNCDVTLTSNKNNVFEGNKAVIRGDMKDVRGGAICIGTGTLTIDGYQFVNNTSEKTGGAIHLNENDKIIAKITDTSFVSNSAQAQGGAIYSGTLSKDGLTVTTSEFTGNTTKTQGGAMHVYGGGKAVVRITDTTFTANSAGTQGGVITAFASSLKITDSNFGGKESTEGNSAVQGGVIYSGDKSKVELVTSKENVFQNNKAEERGGAICIGSGTLTVEGYQFVNNTSAKTGGAIHLNENDTIVANLTEVAFDSNTSAAQGGAIYSGSLNKESLTLAESKFTGNQAGTQGGAIHVYGGGKGLTKLTDTTFVANNAGTQGGAITAFATTLKITDSNFGGKDSTDGNSSVQGGAVYSGQSSKVELITTKNSVFQNNKAEERGGAFTVGSGTLTIDGYQFANNSSSGTGGAIHLNGADIVTTIKGSIFGLNTAKKAGGAIYTDSTNQTTGLTITGTTFTENSTKDSGGAIYSAENSSASVDISECTFANNTATWSGGAMAIKHGTGKTLTVTGSTFKSNTGSKEYGGAIMVQAPTATITDCHFGGANAADGNSATWGGAIYGGKGCALTIKAATSDYAFQNNQATSIGGGAIGVQQGTLTVENYQFVSNSSPSLLGGAIYLYKEDVAATVKGSTFVSNSAKYGGAIYNDSTNVADGMKIENTTFASNTATDSGAAICSGENSTASMTIAGSNFEKNTAKWNAGAIYIRPGKARTLTVSDNSSFTSNVATGGHGGAIRIDASGVIWSIQDSEFISNTSPQGYGGAIYVHNDNISTTIKGSAFVSNTAKNGGAIYTNSTNATDGMKIENTEFSSNTATGSGAALFSEEGSVSPINVTGSTFTGNTATWSGGAMAIKHGTGKTLTVTGSTFKSNTGTKEYGGAIMVQAPTATITDCHFGGANAADGNSATWGGAIYGGKGCALTIKATTSDFAFQNNKATSIGGGAIGVQQGTLTVENYQFTSNSSPSYLGGAIYLYKEDVAATVKGSTFVSNSAKYGGAIYNDSTNVADGMKIENTTFASNTATDSGAAICSGENSTAPMTIAGSRFENNTAKWNAGAIYIRPGKARTLTVSDNSSFTSNVATGGHGGAIRIEASDVICTIQNSTFTSNTAPKGYGGAIYIDPLDVKCTIQNSKFASNVAKNGGAIYNDSTNVADGLKIENTTFTSNTASDSGAAIYSGSNSTAPMTITGSDFEKNTATWNAGAIYINSGKARTLTVSGESTFTSNTATKGNGGAIRIEASDVICTIQNSTFTSNTSPAGQGGAIHNASTNTTEGMTIEDCEFNGNISSSAGGALWSDKTKLTINRTNFTDNKCTTSTSGAIKIGGGSLTATDCNFIGNTAANNGGVVEATGSNPTVVFTVSAGKEGQYRFENNKSTSGGGGAIRANSITSMRIYGYVFSGNSCGGSGSVINAGDACTAGKITIEKCTPLSGADIYSYHSGAVVQTNSLQ